MLFGVVVFVFALSVSNRLCAQACQRWLVVGVGILYTPYDFGPFFGYRFPGYKMRAARRTPTVSVRRFGAKKWSGFRPSFGDRSSVLFWGRVPL